MVANKECDLVVLQGPDRLLPMEAKHHYNAEIWTAWRTQLDRLYSKDAKAGGLGIYLVFWSGIANGRSTEAARWNRTSNYSNRIEECARITHS